jgi:hypothetical protein
MIDTDWRAWAYDAVFGGSLTGIGYVLAGQDGAIVAILCYVSLLALINGINYAREH